MSDTPPKTEGDSPPKAAERPTLKTLAQATGLAVATVSRALHDAPDIGEDTKRRVNRMAREIGYRPNRAGVRLRTGKTNVISLVISTEHEMVNQHTGRLISSIASAFRGTPYHMIVTPYFPSEDVMAPIDYILETGSADAIIMNQIEPQDRRVRRMLDRGFPFATHGRSEWADEHAYFDFDNERFAEIAVECFARRGRGHVAVLAPPLAQSYAQHLLQGAGKAARRCGLDLQRVQGTTSDGDQRSIAAGIANHLAVHPETDAILTPSTISAMTITSVIEGLGKTIGQEVDLFAKQSGDFLTRFRPGILSVIEDIGQAGNFLARAAISRIDHPQDRPMQRLEVPDWIAEP